MRTGPKVIVYVVLSVLALWFGGKFYAEFKATSAANSGVVAPAVPTNEAPAATTNVTAVATNDAAASTNLASGDTNAPATNAAVATATAPVLDPDEDAPIRRPKVGRGKMMSYMGAFLGVLIILGLMAGYDISQFFGDRSVDFIFNEDLKGVYNPEYEEAEQLWANGKPLDAIRMLRDYLKKYPREQYVAIRIAEIYEKDLKNYLAAVLEYEQILTHKLPRERWGWTAIHLCNLYTKINKRDQCVGMLRRIADEYSDTAASKKARKRLAMYESGGDLEALGQDHPEDPNLPDVTPPAAAPSTPPAETKPASNLPPGFRPKK